MNENFNPESDDIGLRGKYKELYEDTQTDEAGNEVPGKLMTKKAEFDLEVYIGAGMPNNKSFLYEATIELHRENVVTTEETRQTLKQLLNWPIINPWEPKGTFAGRNSSAEQLGIANSMTGEQPLAPPTPEAAPTAPPSTASAY